MKVGNVPGVTGVYNKQGISKVTPTKEVKGKKDVVSISNSGQDFNTVLKALREVPDIRQEKVEEISKKIETGTYNVSGKEIVEKVVSRIVDKRI